jgi:glucose-1-phosphate thymidylyltransferase
MEALALLQGSTEVLRYVGIGVAAGTAVIGPGARIRHAYIGPFTSIGSGCVVERTELEFSVLLEDCVVRDIPRMEGSLLGREARISRTERRPLAHRFMVADQSEVEIAGGP